MSTRREVETKFKLKNSNEKESATSRLLAFGFLPKPARQELDYSLDTPDWSCRFNGLIVRFRRVITAGEKPVVRLTLKEKRGAGVYQDYNETELVLATPDRRAWDHIQGRLRQVVGLELPESILAEDDFAQVIAAVRRAGFSRHRILLEKRRREFVLERAGINVTIDSFPDGMGTYLEVEAYDPATLDKFTSQIGLTDYEHEPLDYGDILKRHKQGLPEVTQRTAVFDNGIRSLVMDG